MVYPIEYIAWCYMGQGPHIISMLYYMVENLPLTITILILLAILYNLFFDSEVTRVQSTVDNQSYLVLNLPDKEKAADELARLRSKLEKFSDLLEKNAKNREETDIASRLKRKYMAVLTENQPGGRYTSYTVNKGSKIVMCVRERDENNRLVDENTLFFVALHELAHVVTIGVGHSEEFWNNFRYFLRQAISHGYLEYKPYHLNPQKYCGTYISNTPLKL